MNDLGSKPDIEQLGKTLKSLREQSGLSQKALSEVSGVTVKQISKLENGRAEPKYLTLLAFAGAMGITLDQFREAIHGSEGSEDGIPR